jgi:hypothetical protein
LTVGEFKLTEPLKWYGEWEGVREAVGVYRIELANDAIAHRLAFGIAVITRNDAILVTRPLMNGEGDNSMNSTARFRVEPHIAYSGNRTIVPNGWNYKYVKTAAGDYVAFLVNSDATVSAI